MYTIPQAEGNRVWTRTSGDSDVPASTFRGFQIWGLVMTMACQRLVEVNGDPREVFARPVTFCPTFPVVGVGELTGYLRVSARL